MPTIDLGVNYEDYKDADKFPVAPDGTYEFIVKNVEMGKSKGAKNLGRPMLTWTIQINDPETGIPISLKYWSLLPWINEAGEQITDNLGNLVGVCKGCGIPWTGQALTTEDYIGAGGSVIIGNQNKQEKNSTTGEYEDVQPIEKMNKIDKFVS